MISVSYAVPPNWTAGSDKTGASKNKDPNDPNMLTTGAYGNAFELMLDTKTNSDGTTTDTLAETMSGVPSSIVERQCARFAKVQLNYGGGRGSAYRRRYPRGCWAAPMIQPSVNS